MEELIHQLRRLVRWVGNISERRSKMTLRDQHPEYHEKIEQRYRDTVKADRKSSLFTQVKYGCGGAIILLIAWFAQQFDAHKSAFGLFFAKWGALACLAIAVSAVWKLWKFRKEADQSLSREILSRILEHNTKLRKAHAKQLAEEARRARQGGDAEPVVPEDGFAPPSRHR